MKERKVIGLAVDTLSLDHGPSKDFKVHHAWLPSERWGLRKTFPIWTRYRLRFHSGGRLGESEGRDGRSSKA